MEEKAKALVAILWLILALGIPVAIGTPFVASAVAKAGSAIVWSVAVTASFVLGGWLLLRSAGKEDT